MARACGSYPQCPRFKSRCRYHVARDAKASRVSYGPLVKWLRHGPFTAVTWVRIPYGSPTHKTPSVLWVTSSKSDIRYGGLAQLVRAPASHAGGHWFESSSLHQIKTPPNGWCFFFFNSPICGGFLLVATGCRMAKMQEFPIADMLPAMVLVMPLSALWVNCIVPLL